MAEHTKGPRYGYCPNRTYSRFCVMDTTNGKKVATTDSPHLASQISANMNALEGYNPDAVRDVVEAAKRALNFIQNTESELGEPLDSGDALRAALARLGGAS